MQNKLNVLTFVTIDYVTIMRDYFLKTIPKEIESVDIKCININDYHRDNINVAIELEKFRTKYIIEKIKSCDNQYIMMIDSDVIFSGIDFKYNVINSLQNNDIIFQKQNDTCYNFGVFALKSNEKTLKLFEKLLEELNKDYSDGYFSETINMKLTKNEVHDQWLINDILRFSNIYDVKHGFLDLEYYGNHLFGNYDFPSNWILFHSTSTHSLEDKINLLNRYINK